MASAGVIPFFLAARFANGGDHRFYNLSDLLQALAFIGEVGRVRMLEHNPERLA
jgi:hypothetical protein